MLGWWLTGLLDLDEGFYGAVGAEMNRRGEWITPFYNGRPWFEKPIMVYWLLKPSLLLGSDFGARLPSVLSHLATCGVLAWFANRRLRPGSGAMAALVYGSMLLPVALGRLLMTDAPLVLCTTVALVAYWESRERPRFLILCGAALGAGVLAKGPVALLLFASPMLYLAWRDPFWRIRAWAGIISLGLLILVITGWMAAGRFGYGTGSIIAGALVFGLIAAVVARFQEVAGKYHVTEWGLAWGTLLIVVASWYLPCYLANGDAFVQGFLIDQNFKRFTGGDAAHTLTNPLAYLAYFPVVLMGAGPWLVTMATMRTRWRTGACDSTESRTDGDGPRSYAPVSAFLTAWAISVFLFFTISGAKLPHYVLPLFPPLALLIADRLATDRPRFERMGRGWCVGMAIFANFAFLAWYTQSGQSEAHRLARPLRTFEGTVATYQLSRRQKGQGTGRLKIQETSLPSLGLVTDRTWTNAETWSEIETLSGPVRVFTRVGRLPAIPPGWREVSKGDNYVVYGRP